MWWEDWKSTQELILFQKPRVGHLLNISKHKECPVVQSHLYRSSQFAYTIQTAHVLSRKALYSQASRQTYTHCRRNAIEGAPLTSDTDNNTLYTINTLHDKRTPHATATIVIISICVCLFGHQQDHNYIIKPCCSNVYIWALILSVVQLCEKFILKSILCAKRMRHGVYNATSLIFMH